MTLTNAGDDLSPASQYGINFNVSIGPSTTEAGLSTPASSCGGKMWTSGASSSGLAPTVLSRSLSFLSFSFVSTVKY